MKKIVFHIFMWIHWKCFHKDMKKVIGFNSLDILNKELNNLEQEIRHTNEIPIHQEISWGNSQRTDRAEYARYITYKHFSQKGEWLMLSKKLSLFSTS